MTTETEGTRGTKRCGGGVWVGIDRVERGERQACAWRTGQGDGENWSSIAWPSRLGDDGRGRFGAVARQIFSNGARKFF